MAHQTPAHSQEALMNLLSPAQLDALQAGKVLVTGSAGRYIGRVLASTSLQTAWSVLTDYEHFADFLPNVVSSRVLKAEGDRKVVEQIDHRKVLLVEVESRVCTENIEVEPENRINFHLVEGDLKQLQGTWQLNSVGKELTTQAPQVLITQTVDADAKAGLFDGAFYSIFENSLEANLDALRKEAERRS